MTVIMVKFLDKNIFSDFFKNSWKKIRPNFFGKISEKFLKNLENLRKSRKSKNFLLIPQMDENFSKIFRKIFENFLKKIETIFSTNF